MASGASGFGEKMNALEKKAIQLSVLFVAAILALIAYANWGMKIHVPSCVPTEKLFQNGSVTKIADKKYEVHMLAKMWGFEPSRIRVPVGSTVELLLTSKDVTHGFQILGTNVNLMAVPGSVTPAEVHFAKPGVYLMVCHEYCGAAHEQMNGVFEVSAEATDITAEGLPSSDEARKLLEAKGCLACHSLDGTQMAGPTLKGIWGGNAELADGTIRRVDAEFLSAVIKNPSKYAMKGYAPIMPELPMSDEEIRLIQEYVKGLK